MTSVTVSSSPFLVSVDDAGTSVTVSATGPAGQGVPAGGSSGQVLKKSSGTDYATEWASGGTGDLLASNNLSEVNATTARTNLGAAATNHNHAAGNITSGTLATDRIPDLAASKITSGTLDAARIPTLGTGDISGLGDSATKDVGTASDEVAAGNDSRFTDARTPVAHSADLVTSGTLAVARGGTGVTSVPMVGVISAADAGAARTVLGLGTAAVAATGTGSSNVILGNDARLSDDRDPTAHSTDKLTSGTLAVARGGTGVTSLPMISVVTAADAAASRSALGLGTAAVAATGTGSANVILGNDSRLTDDRDPNAHSADKITSGTLAVARGGTGVTSLPMVSIPAAADAAAARTVLGLGTAATSATGAFAAAAHTHEDSYAMFITAPADKASPGYVVDARVASARTITNFYAKTESGSCVATLRNITDNVEIASVTANSSGASDASLLNTSVAENERIGVVISSNSSGVDLQIVVEYTA